MTFVPYISRFATYRNMIDRGAPGSVWLSGLRGDEQKIYDGPPIEDPHEFYDLQGLVESKLMHDERDWHVAGCPEYRVFPALVDALAATDIDIRCPHLRLPFRTFAISLPERSIREHEDAPWVEALLVSEIREPLALLDKSDLVTVLDGGARIVKRPVGAPQVRKLILSVALSHRPGDPLDLERRYHGVRVPMLDEQTLEECFKLVGENPVQREHQRQQGGYWMEVDFSMRLGAIALGVSFFAIGRTREQQPHPMCEPARRPRAERRREQRELGAERKVFDVGRALVLPKPLEGPRSEVDPNLPEDQRRHLSHGHVRSGHLRWQRYGSRQEEGRYELIFVPPTVVRPDLPLKPRATPHEIRPSEGPLVTLGGEA